MSAVQPMLLPDTIEEKFQRWLRDNPATVEHVRELAVKWYRAGHDRCGVGMLAEVARWHGGVDSAKDEDGFRINNNHRALLARHLIATTLELPTDFFELRERRSSEVAR